MKFVVDASVAIKWVVEEDGRDIARGLVSEKHELVAPEFVLIEVGNILWKKVRRGEMDQVQAISALDEIRVTFDRYVASLDLSVEALGLSLALDHPVYDCVYVAFAEQEDAQLVTADKRLVRLLTGTRHAKHIVMLESLIHD